MAYVIAGGIIWILVFLACVDALGGVPAAAFATVGAVVGLVALRGVNFGRR